MATPISDADLRAVAERCKWSPAAVSRALGRGAKPPGSLGVRLRALRLEGDRVEDVNGEGGRAETLVEAPDAPAWQSYRPRVGWVAPGPDPVARVESLARPRKIICIPDVHIPHHDRKAWATTLGIIREDQPDEIVILGDFVSFASVSRHAKSSPDRSRIAEEYHEANLALDQLEKAAGAARIYYCEGNHERRPTKYVNDNEHLAGDDTFNVPVSLYIHPKPDGYFRSKAQLREQITWLPLKKYIKRAWVSPWGVGYMHSAKAEARAAGGKNQAAYHAEVVCPLSGCRVIVFGHSHTHQMFRSATGAEAWCGGFLGNFDGDDPDPDFDYEMGPNPWTTGITRQEIDGDAISTTQIRIANGRAIMGGRVVSA
jgi:predicted phosphodiesterase